MPSATARTTTGILIASLAISSFSGIAGAAIDPGSSTRQTDFDDPSTWPKESEYSGNIQQCLDTPENERATIRSFICPSGNAAGNLLDTSYQVAIDSAFRKIDKESESFIKTLKDSGGSKITDVNLAIRGKFAEGGELQKQYMALCQSRALREGISHFGAVSTEWDIKQYLESASTNRCEALVKMKMAAFTKAAQTVAGYSATQAQKEGKGEFMRKMRSAYTELANKFMRVVGQMATIRDKMPSKTPTVVS